MSSKKQLAVENKTTMYTRNVYTINSIDDYKSYGFKLLKQSNNKKIRKYCKKNYKQI